MSVSDFEIEKYFDDELTPDQRKAFEERMQSDALFAREVREHRQVRKDLLQQGERLNLIDYLEDVHAREFGGAPYLKDKVKDDSANSSDSSQDGGRNEVLSEPEETKPSAPQKDKSNHTRGGGKVVTMRNFYIGMGIAASLAAIVTLSGVWFSELDTGVTAVEEGYNELMEETAEPESADTNYGVRGYSSGSGEGGNQSSKKYRATAFAVAKDGYFITNNHVVKGSKKLTLKLVDENLNWTSFNAFVVLDDEFSDLALVKIDDTNFTELGILPFVFSNKQAMIGEEVFTMGYPKNDIVMEPGIISSTTGLDGDTTAYQVSMALNSGNSGGPIFNDKGEVVAIVKGKHNGKEGTGYAVRSDYLWNLIRQYEAESGTNIKRPKWNQLRNKRREQLVRHVRNFVFMLEAEK